MMHARLSELELRHWQLSSMVRSPFPILSHASWPTAAYRPSLVLQLRPLPERPLVLGHRSQYSTTTESGCTADGDSQAQEIRGDHLALA